MRLSGVLVLSAALAGCGSSGSGGGASGSGASGGSGGGAGSGGSAGSGLGGNAGVAAGGAAGAGGSGALGGGGSGADGGWKATTEWTSLPIPLQFGPTLAPHPKTPSELSVLASAYSGTQMQVVAATTTDLGMSFAKPAPLSPLPQTAMAEPKGVAYSPKNPLELAAVVWIQGPPSDPASGGHLFRSTDGGKTFADTALAKSLPMNALAFARLRYTADGLIAIRSGSSVVYTQDGATTSDSVDTPGCSASPGNAAFDASPTNGKQVAVPCGTSLAVCTKAGCTKSSATLEVVDVSYGADAQHLGAIGRGTDGSLAVLVSEDGGKSFATGKTFKENLTPSWRVAWDPRPGKTTLYGLLFAHLFQSDDGGKTWQDVTPPPALNYLYDFVVTADGTLFGRGVFHYLVRPPTY